MSYFKLKQHLPSNQKGSVLIMAVIMSIVVILIGTVFLKFADHTRQLVTWNIAESQARYAAKAGVLLGQLEYDNADGLPDGFEGPEVELFENVRCNYEIVITNILQYGLSTIIKYIVLGKGKATTYEFDEPVKYVVGWAAGVQSFAEWLYMTDRETQEYRPAGQDIIRFWGPDTLDGKVHSNDKLHFEDDYNGNWPVFWELVTSCSTRFDPWNAENYVYFAVEPQLGYSYIYLPNTADSVRAHNGIIPIIGNPAPNVVTEVTLDLNTIYVRYRIADSLSREQDPSQWTWLNGDTFREGDQYPVPSSGALFIDDEVWIAAPKNKSHYTEPGGDSLHGFVGQLTIAASGDIIVAQDVVVASVEADGTVPETSEDLLGLISEKHLLMWRHCPSVVNITAGLAAVGYSIPDTFPSKACINGQISEDGNNGTISMDGINCYDFDNEKAELFIYGCLIQRERGLIHTSYQGGQRGFISKDYHYDFRFSKTPPPHFLTTDNPRSCYFESGIEGL